jgi:transposase
LIGAHSGSVSVQSRYRAGRGVELRRVFGIAGKQHAMASARLTPVTRSWFNEPVAQNGGRFKRVMITALVRKLVVSLWKHASAGIGIEGAVVRP